MRMVLTCTLVAALLPQSTAVQPPRDAPLPAATAAQKAGTGAIRGRVFDRETGAAIPGVVLTLSRTIVRPPDTPAAVDTGLGRIVVRPDPPPTTRSDAQGRFAFERLVAGEYRLLSSQADFKVTYLAQVYGAARPVDPTRPSSARPLQLADGQVVENADIPLWRSLAITGHVADEYGEPLAGVPIAVTVPGTDLRAGFRGPYQIISDDRGAFRMFGLTPGRYIVCATPQSYQMRSDDTPERYVKTCAPSVASEADAQIVELTAGDYGDVEIRLLRARAYKVTGIALDSQGKPVQQVSMSRKDISGFSGPGGRVEPDGRFTFNGVTSGDYTIVAQVGMYGMPDAASREREFAATPLHVDGADVENIAITTAKGATVPGRVIFEGGTPPPGGKLVISLYTVSGSDVVMVGPAPTADVKADQTFTLTSVFGPLGVGVNGMPPGWVIKAVRFGDDDVTDRPVHLQGGSRLEVVLSNRTATLTGRVASGPDDEVSDYRVALFPVERERWLSPYALRTIPLNRDWTFKLGAVRPGEYLVALVRLEDLASSGTTATRLERLAKAAQRVTLSEDDQRAIELAVSR